jgi:hypothetical protein
MTMAVAIGATSAGADVLLPGREPSQPREVTVTGTVAELTEGHLTLDAAQTGGARRSFRFDGPVRTDALGLRLGDPVAVLLRGRGNPASAPVAAVDRILPVADLRLRVYTAERGAEPAALGKGPGCWVGGTRGTVVELCFLSTSDAVALRYAGDGKLACSARLASARDGDRWTVTAAPSCRGNASWALADLNCDAAAQSCSIALADPASAERFVMTRR